MDSAPTDKTEQAEQTYRTILVLVGIFALAGLAIALSLLPEGVLFYDILVKVVEVTRGAVVILVVALVVAFGYFYLKQQEKRK